MNSKSGLLNSYRDGIGEATGLDLIRMGELIVADQSAGLILNLTEQIASIAFFKKNPNNACISIYWVINCNFNIVILLSTVIFFFKLLLAIIEC